MADATNKNPSKKEVLDINRLITTYSFLKNPMNGGMPLRVKIKTIKLIFTRICLLVLIISEIYLTEFLWIK
jgi:hypothetical protein